MINFNHPISPNFIAVRIKIGRELSNLTQSRLSEITGLTQTQISRLEKAQSQSLDINDIFKIATAFSLSLSEFLETDINLFKKSIAANIPKTPEDKRFMDWTNNNFDLQKELEEWLNQDKVITFENTNSMENFLATKAMEKASIINSNINAEEILPSQTLMTVDKNYDYNQIIDKPIYSQSFIPELFKYKAKAILSVASTSEWEFLSSEWKELTEKGWLHILDDGNKIYINQIYHTNNANNLVVIPIWKKDKHWSRKNLTLRVNTDSSDIPSYLLIENPYQPEQDKIPFGINSQGKPFGIHINNFDKHSYLCGTTGAGKSNLLEWWSYGITQSNKPLIFMTPHFEDAEVLISNIQQHMPDRSKDIILLDFYQKELAFNPLDIKSHNEIYPVSQAIKHMMLHLLNISPDGAPRAINYLEQSMVSMLEYNLTVDSEGKKCTLLNVTDFFTDKEYRQNIVKHSKNISIQQTFAPDGPFETLGERIQIDHVMPILRIFSQLARITSFVNVFGQKENKIDFAKLINQNKIVIIKLPIASEVSIVASSLVASLLLQSANKWEEKEAYFVVDEFQNYDSQAMINILEQGRKFNLHLIACNQVPSQLSSKTLQAIRNNASHKTVMRIHQTDAESFAPYLNSGKEIPQAKDIVSLPNYYGWTTHTDKNGQNITVKFKGLKPLQNHGIDIEKIIKQSSMYYSN